MKNIKYELYLQYMYKNYFSGMYFPRIEQRLNHKRFYNNNLILKCFIYLKLKKYS